MGSTYANEKSRDSSHDGQCEDQRDNDRGTARVGAEDVVDLRQLSVTQRLLVGRDCDAGVDRDLYIKNGRYKTFGRAEGSDDEGCLEGLGRGEQLGGNVLLSLRTPGVSLLQVAIWAQVGGGCASQGPTNETVPLPLSLTVRGNGASSPLSSSFRSKMAW